MSLSCLTCQGRKRREMEDLFEEATESPPFDGEKPGASGRRRHPGCLGCSRDKRLRKGSASFSSPAKNSPRKAIRKTATCPSAAMEERAAAAAAGEPRLVRCSGMRRDWSFEDLTKICGFDPNNVRRNLR